MEQTTVDGRPENKPVVQAIIDTAIKVMTQPVEFFQTMPKSGGFADPLVFAVLLGVVSGVVRAVLGLLHLGGALGFGTAILAIIVTPVIVLIGEFIVAAILFVIWKLMGSNESYETAFRCSAYSAAISPIVVLVNIVPYVGGLAGLAWGLYLIVTASVETHKIASKTAWMVFGITAVVLALFSINAQIAARRWQRNADAWSKQIRAQTGETGKPMTPEEAGRAAAAFMKGMQEEAAKNAGKSRAGQDAQ